MCRTVQVGYCVTSYVSFSTPTRCPNHVSVALTKLSIAINAIKLAATLTTIDMVFEAPAATASMKFVYDLFHNKDTNEKNLSKLHHSTH